MMTRAEKEAVVKNLQENMEKAQAVFLTNLIGIPSNDAVRLRKELRDADGNIIITRNTLFARAAKGTSYEGVLSDLKGPNAVAFAFSDAARVAKALFDASKEHDVIELKSGVLEDKELDAKDVEALAKLPSRDQMLGTLLATFMAPISSFARVMEEIRKQKDGGENAQAQAE